MTETELTLAIIIFETTALLGIGCIVGLVLVFQKWYYDIKTVHKIVQRTKEQEQYHIQLLCDQLQKLTQQSSMPVASMPIENLARKILLQQHMLIADVTELFFKRDRRIAIILGEKLASYTKMLFTLQRGESLSITSSVETASPVFPMPPQSKQALSKQLEEMSVE